MRTSSALAHSCRLLVSAALLHVAFLAPAQAGVIFTIEDPVEVSPRTFRYGGSIQNDVGGGTPYTVEITAGSFLSFSGSPPLVSQTNSFGDLVASQPITLPPDSNRHDGALFFLIVEPGFLGGGGTYQLAITQTSASGQVINGSLDAVFEIPNTVPEPASAALVGIALVSAGALVWRRR